MKVFSKGGELIGGFPCKVQGSPSLNWRSTQHDRICVFSTGTEPLPAADAKRFKELNAELSRIQAALQRQKKKMEEAQHKGLDPAESRKQFGPDPGLVEQRASLRKSSLGWQRSSANSSPFARLLTQAATKIARVQLAEGMYPGALAVSGDKLFVSDNMTKTVKVFNRADGKKIVDDRKGYALSAMAFRFCSRQADGRHLDRQHGCLSRGSLFGRRQETVELQHGQTTTGNSQALLRPDQSHRPSRRPLAGA